MEKNTELNEEIHNEDHHKACVDITNSFCNKEVRDYIMALQDHAKKDEDPFALIERCSAIAFRSMLVYNYSMIGDENKEPFKAYCYNYVSRFFRVIEVLGEPEDLRKLAESEKDIDSI